MKKDNSTFRLKALLRDNLLKEIAEPIVLEAYGGYGRLWSRCYSHIEEGVVFEKDAKKTLVLARDRPTWAVYEADCVHAIQKGVGSHLNVNYFDFDAWGNPWPAIDALLESRRPWPEIICIVVTDGLSKSTRVGGGGDVQSIAAVIEKYGRESVHNHYLDICKELMAEKTGAIGYKLHRWAGYYCGHAKTISHYAAVLTKKPI